MLSIYFLKKIMSIFYNNDNNLNSMFTKKYEYYFKPEMNELNILYKHCLKIDDKVTLLIKDKYNQITQNFFIFILKKNINYYNIIILRKKKNIHPGEYNLLFFLNNKILYKITFLYIIR